MRPKKKPVKKKTPPKKAWRFTQDDRDGVVARINGMSLSLADALARFLRAEKMQADQVKYRVDLATMDLEAKVGVLQAKVAELEKRFEYVAYPFTDARGHELSARTP